MLSKRVLLLELLAFLLFLKLRLHLLLLLFLFQVFLCFFVNNWNYLNDLFWLQVVVRWRALRATTRVPATLQQLPCAFELLSSNSFNGTLVKHLIVFFEFLLINVMNACFYKLLSLREHLVDSYQVRCYIYLTIYSDGPNEVPPHIFKVVRG